VHRDLTKFDQIEWLQPGRTGLRGVLRDLESAIRKGQLAGPKNADLRLRLVKAIEVLVEAPSLPPKVLVRVAKVTAAMIEANLLMEPA
jgi:hypothetical protein